jgi:repressor LexA
MTLELNPRNGDGPDGRGARGSRGARGARSARDARGVGKSTASSASSVALTRRQREIYDFISGFVVEQGYSPSLEEIAAAFGLSSVATVHKHVKHLVDKGYLRKAWNRSRSVEPVPPEPEVESVDSLYLPILGTVAAGRPIEAIEPDAASAEQLAIPADMIRCADNHYVLRVRGDSMIEDQICDGDMVVIEGRHEARNGETVVALVDGDEATLKRFYKEGAQVKLVPANQTMLPMEFHASQVEIRGVVRGLIRQF